MLLVMSQPPSSKLVLIVCQFPACANGHPGLNAIARRAKPEFKAELVLFLSKQPTVDRPVLSTKIPHVNVVLLPQTTPFAIAILSPKLSIFS
jgi:hypothetical protein